MKYSPMLTKDGNEEILSSKEHIFEPKLDGYRAICYYRQKKNKPEFISRNGNNLPFQVRFRLKSDCVLDGEIISYGDSGNPDFNLLRNGGFPVFVAFDILEKEGKDLRELSLIERKKILASIIEEQEEQDQLQLGFFSEKGDDLMRIAKKRGIEGVIAKRKEGKYLGRRSDSWLKIKLFRTIDCIILGYNTKKRRISSLRLGLYDDTKKIVEIGNVGTGFTDDMLDELWQKLNDPKRKESLICEVRYHEFYKALRAPVFLRLRDDKTQQECTIDQLDEKARRELQKEVQRGGVSSAA